MTNCQGSFPWVTLIAALGIGSVIAAVVGWWSAKAVAISNHRQDWINSLRDDIAKFLKEIDVLHYRLARLSGINGKPATIADLDNQQDARNAAMLAYRMILMRLNMNELASVELGQRLEALMTITSSTADEDRVKEVVTASRIVLSQEWAVTKYGFFTWPILAIKQRLKSDGKQR